MAEMGKPISVPSLLSVLFNHTRVSSNPHMASGSLLDPEEMRNFDGVSCCCRGTACRVAAEGRRVMLLQREAPIVSESPRDWLVLQSDVPSDWLVLQSDVHLALCEL